jgi:hypothetical protein
VTTKRQRLALLISREGFKSVVLRPAEGYWRTSPFADVYRWEGEGVAYGRKDLPEGFPCTFASWDTMSQCVKTGVELSPGDSGLGGDFLVHAKARKRD